MNEKIVGFFVLAWDQIGYAFIFFGVGVLIAVGQLLASDQRLTWRIIVGRCITTGGIALGAGAALAVFPGLPFVAQIGIASMLASLGTSGLELLIRRIFGRK